MGKFNLMGAGSNADCIPFDKKDFWINYTRNTGNMLFYYACERLLDLDSKRYGWGGGSDINTQSNGLLIPMANQIGSHFDLELSGPKIFDVKKSIVLMGLGSQLSYSSEAVAKVPEGTIKWLKSVAGKTNGVNIAVRGENTQKFMEDFGVSKSSIVTGCPSLMINPNPHLGESIKALFFEALSSKTLFDGLSVAAGDPHHKNLGLAHIERHFIDLIDRYSGSYVIQNPEILIKLNSNWYEELSDEELMLIQKRWFPSKDSIGIKKWIKQNAITFFSVPNWLFFLSGKSLVLGTRIHGVQAAIQAGIPGICFYMDSRTQELCETMNIPSAPAEKYINGLTETDCINILADWDATSFDRNRMLLATKFKSLFISNEIKYKKENLFDL